jgi:WD40 repeat protein
MVNCFGKPCVWAFRLLLAAPVALFGDLAHAADDAVPRMDLSNHSDVIFGLAASIDGEFVVTGGLDATVRIWSASDLKPVGPAIRMPAGNDLQGAIYTAAFSPDGKSIAAAGWTGSWGNENGPWCFYVISLDDRTLRQTVCDLPQRPNHLAYSPDGRFLAFSLKAAPFGHTEGASVRVYRTGDYTLVAADAAYGSSSNYVDFLPDGRMVTGSMDGKIRLYDKDLDKTVNLIPALSQTMPEGRRVDGLAIAPDGSKIAVGYFERGDNDPQWVPAINILSSADLSFLPRPDLHGIDNGTLNRVAWSGDGAFLYAGGTWKKGERFQIRRWAAGGAGRPYDIPASPTEILHLRTVPHGQVVFAGALPYFATLGPDGKIAAERPLAIDDFTNIGDSLAVSPDAYTVAFSSVGRPAHISLLQRVLQPGEPPDADKMSHPVTYDDKLDVEGAAGGSSGYHPTLNGRALPMQLYEQALSLTYLPDGKGFLLGTIWAVRRYDANGKLLWHSRVPYKALAVVSTPDARIAVAALGNGTLRWFNMETGEVLVTLFPDPDAQRWVAWTQQGYYMASVGGDALFGWQVNRGREQTGDFFPVGRFEDQYLRPDIVTKTLSLLDEPKAIEAARRENGRAPATGSIVQMLPPVIKILSPASGAIDDTVLTLRFQVRSPSGQPITKIEARVGGGLLTLNELPTLDPTGQAVGDFTVVVPQDDSVVALYAENKFGASEPSTIALKWQGERNGPEQIPHRIYVLAIGVNDFADAAAHQVPHLTYPSKDAQDFVGAIESQKGKAFINVVAKVLTDENGNTSLTDIRDGLAWLDKEAARKDDIGVLFLAGHGFNDRDGTYYYLPHTGQLDDLRNTGVPYSDLLSALTRIGGYPVLFIDTCDAADVAGHALSTEVDGTVNRLSKEPKGIIVYASSMGEQQSFEAAMWQNGAFTHIVVEGLKGAARYENLDYITSSMLETYIKVNVRRLTGGRQQATANMPIGVDDLLMALPPR